MTLFDHDELYLRNPLRGVFQSPAKILAELGVRQGFRILDAGAGFGYLSLQAARMVGSSGVVYAVEPDSRRAAVLRARARHAGLDWVVVLNRPLELFGEESAQPVDRAVMFMSLHHMTEPTRALRVVHSKLKADGVFLAVEPRRNSVFRHGSEPRTLHGLLVKAGFRVVGHRVSPFSLKFVAEKE